MNCTAVFFLTSRRFLGLLTMLVGMICQAVGYGLDEVQVGNVAGAIFEVVGFVVALVGSAKAKGPWTLERPADAVKGYDFSKGNGGGIVVALLTAAISVAIGMIVAIALSGCSTTGGRSNMLVPQEAPGSFTAWSPWPGFPAVLPDDHASGLPIPVTPFLARSEGASQSGLWSLISVGATQNHFLTVVYLVGESQAHVNASLSTDKAATGGNPTASMIPQ